MCAIIRRGAVLLAFAIACSRSGESPATSSSTSDAGDRIDREVAAAATQAGVPSDAKVAEYAKIRDHDTGGRFSATVAGALSASVDARDANFCLQTMSVGKFSAKIFSMTLIGNEVAVSFGASDQAVAPGTVKIGTESAGGFTAMVIDKRGDQVFYKSMGGELTFTKVADDRVAGSFRFSAVPDAGGKPVTAEGSFEATKASGCGG